MTNLLDKDSGKPIANCKPYHVLESPGLKIGFLGFAEEPWLDCLDQCIDVDKL